MGNEEADTFVVKGRERGARHLSGIEPCSDQKDGESKEEVDLHICGWCLFNDSLPKFVSSSCVSLEL